MKKEELLVNGMLSKGVMGSAAPRHCQVEDGEGAEASQAAVDSASALPLCAAKRTANPFLDISVESQSQVFIQRMYECI